MGQKVFFKPGDDSWVEYAIENDFLSIRCVVNKNNCEVGTSLYIYDAEGKNLCLGTLSASNECYSISKSYPVSYLHFQGIDTENITGFVLKKDNQNLISTMEQTEIITSSTADESEDPALTRAKNLLSGFGGGDYSNEAKEYLELITDRLKNYPVKTISLVPGFSWYVINDIKETFQLSGIEHLIFCESFIRFFAKTGEWYMGKGEEQGMFALAIEAESESVNPFSNGADCSRFVSADNGTGYWIVGLGLFSDGQYFCRI